MIIMCRYMNEPGANSHHLETLNGLPNPEIRSRLRAQQRPLTQVTPLSYL